MKFDINVVDEQTKYKLRKILYLLNFYHLGSFREPCTDRKRIFDVIIQVEILFVGLNVEMVVFRIFVTSA